MAGIPGGQFGGPAMAGAPGMTPGLAGGWQSFNTPGMWAGAAAAGQTDNNTNRQMVSFAANQQAVQNYASISQMRQSFQAAIEASLAGEQNLGQIMVGNQLKLSKNMSQMASSAV